MHETKVGSYRYIETWQANGKNKKNYSCGNNEKHWAVLRNS